MPLPRSPVRRRYGFTVLEVTVSMIFLGTLLAVIVPLSKRVNDQARESATRRAALLEISNALETITSDRAAWPAAGERRKVPLSDSLAHRLEEPVLEVSTVALDDSSGRRFDAALTWLEPTGSRSAPIRLSAFAFDAASAAGGEP